MNVIFKGLFDFFVSGLSVSDNALLNFIVMLIIGFIAYIVSRSIVGSFYHEGFISGKSMGSLLHWISRQILTIFMFFLAYIVIAIIKLVLSVPWWVWLFVLVTLVAIVAYILVKRNSAPTKSN
jgi:hypothetical protein